MTVANSMMARRAFLAAGLALSGLCALPAQAGTPAEDFVASNIQKGLAVLNDAQLTAEQRGQQFEQILLGLTNMKRIALFTLGQYARTASDADKADFAAAFQDYAVAVYRSYLGNYAGQSLKVVGSTARGPDDFIVDTVMVDPRNGNAQSPLHVNFRVRTDSGKPELTDFSVAGVWIALSQRDQFVAFLAQNKGDVKTLSAHLRQTASQYR
ncbi:MAG: ABC transporter substrate-binding protein [Alphaproteobacteria bacterium]|nr:ABC transporter substrate-binding protein [Alphaproteobacteria bacterium]